MPEHHLDFGTLLHFDDSLVRIYAKLKIKEITTVDIYRKLRTEIYDFSALLPTEGISMQSRN